MNAGSVKTAGKTFECTFCGLDTPVEGEHFWDGEPVCVTCAMWLEREEAAWYEMMDHPEDYTFDGDV